MNSWQCGNVCMIDFLFYDTFRYSTNVHIFYNPCFLRIPVLYNLKIFSFLSFYDGGSEFYLYLCYSCFLKLFSFLVVMA